MLVYLEIIFHQAIFISMENKHTDAVVVHNNFIEGHDEKVERFKKAELWRTN
jgi:hypothetical protein